jgi:predicted nucleotidyltransferase component of viral defense system
MLRREELVRWAATFGVADEQVRRDHLVSHVLAALSTFEDPGIVFYGGTALARTHLPNFRVSEDVDLLVDPRAEWADRIESHLPRALRRHFGTVTWDPPPKATSGRLVAGRLSVRVHLESLDAERSRWPVERRAVDMRYSDVEPRSMVVPTLSAFTAMKSMAWADRHTPRDLADLAALASNGAFDAVGADLVRVMGGWRPPGGEFDQLPAATRAAWNTELAHQMAVVPDPDERLATVKQAWVRQARSV